MKALQFILKISNRIRRFHRDIVLVKYNRAKIKAMGGVISKNVKICTPCVLDLEKNSSCFIGDNVTISGSPYTNPLNHHAPIIKVCSGAKLEIGNGCGLSSPTIWCSDNVILKKGVGLGSNVFIMDTDAHSLDWRQRLTPETDKANCKKNGIVIGEYVLVGMNSIILKGVHIGNHSVIGAGSIVASDIPNDCIAAGNPCRVIKYIKK